jgi:hypothetical protein
MRAVSDDISDRTLQLGMQLACMHSDLVLTWFTEPWQAVTAQHKKGVWLVSNQLDGHVYCPDL